ncbi:hypothetical protein ABGV42_03440 [Paenibacillus pabuli]|uniref:hypothetical protein n=1 Tax=Paenibacillus pabuli TaxID=1472 RepID=UPI003241D24E
MLKKRSIVNVSFTIIIIVLIVIFPLDKLDKRYGNDEESIKQVVASIDGYENESIEILEIRDFDDIRMVGFLSDNSPAYIHFIKNKRGNYEWKHIEKSPNQSFASFLLRESSEEAKLSTFMIITNQANEIAKMQLYINEQLIQQEFDINQKSVTWIDLPEIKSETYEFKYKFYDKDNELIGDL